MVRARSLVWILSLLGFALLPACGGCGGGGGGGSDGGTDGGGGTLEVVEHSESTVTGDTTWAAAEHVLSGSLQVSGGTLTVEPCSILRMPAGAILSVSGGGSLHFVGTPDCPITITSAASTPAPGDWDQIEIYADSVGPENRFEWVVVEYGGGSTYGSVWIDDGAELAMENTVIRSSGDVGLDVAGGGSLRAFASNSLSANAKAPIRIGANAVDDLQDGNTFTGNGVDAIVVRGETVDHDATWLAHDVPYVADSGFNVTASADGSARLTLEAGVTVKLGDGAIVGVNDNGGLHLAGTSAAPVTITSTQDGAAGVWDQIEIYSGSIDAANLFEFAVIEGGGGSTYGLVWVDAGASVTIHDSTLRNSGDVGIYVSTGGAIPGFDDNTITGCAGAPIAIDANATGTIGPGTFRPNGIEAIHVYGGTIDHDMTWLSHDVPYVIDGMALTAAAGGSAVLTVEAGATLAMAAGSWIEVNDNGGLVTSGTASARVTITSAKATPAPGDWHEIDVYAGANQVHLTSTDIAYGGGAGYGQIWVESNAQIQLDDVTFAHARDSCDITTGQGSQVQANNTPYVACP